MPFIPPPPDEIKIYGQRQHYSADGGLTYEGNVVARYGATKVTADRVVVYRTQMRAIAQGHVTLVDPDGTALADRAEFSWDPIHPTNSGENVSVRLGNVSFHARTATFDPGRWVLRDVEGTSCLRPNPVYLVTSDYVEIKPGQAAYIHKPRVSVLGKYLGELPTQRPPLTQAAPGLRYPAPAYNLKHGLGATWSGGIVAGEDATFTFFAHGFERTKPAAAALYTKSFVPIAKVSQIVAPRDDFSERFGYGYFDSAYVATPASEEQFLRATRSSISGGGQINSSASDRDRGTRYSKTEAVYESSGATDGYGLLGQIRLQGIQREQETMEGRLAFSGVAGGRPIQLAPGLQTLTRLDSDLFVGRTLFGWARGMAGVTYAPKGWFRLSTAGFVSTDAGNPQFGIDPLYSKNGVLLRSDFINGGFRFSYLTKFDADRGNYDHEFILTQVIGCVELAYAKREYPHTRRLSLTLRLDPLLDIVKRRSTDRNGEPASSRAKDVKTDG